MWMGMKPIGAGAILHFKFIDISLAWPHCILRMAIHRWRYDQAVPVDDGILRQVVFEMNTHLLACADTDDRAQVGIGERLQDRCRTLQHFPAIRPHRRRRTE